MENSSYRENIKPLTISLQLLHKLVNRRDRKFPEKLVDYCLMDRFRALQIARARTRCNLSQQPAPKNIGFLRSLRMK